MRAPDRAFAAGYLIGQSRNVAAMVPLKGMVYFAFDLPKLLRLPDKELKSMLGVLRKRGLVAQA